MRYDRSEYPEQLGRTILTSLVTDRPSWAGHGKVDRLWEEIRENYTKSGKGIIGSGFGHTLLHAFASRGKELPCLLLLERGADFLARDNSGYAVIHAAAEGGSVVIVKALLEKGANANEKNNNDMTPLMCATALGQIDVARLLLGTGADMSTKHVCGSTPLIIGATKGNVEMVNLLLSRNSGRTRLTQSTMKEIRH